MIPVMKAITVDWLPASDKTQSLTNWKLVNLFFSRTLREPSICESNHNSRNRVKQGEPDWCNCSSLGKKRLRQLQTSRKRRRDRKNRTLECGTWTRSNKNKKAEQQQHRWSSKKKKEFLQFDKIFNSLSFFLKEGGSMVEMKWTKYEKNLTNKKNSEFFYSVAFVVRSIKTNNERSAFNHSGINCNNMPGWLVWWLSRNSGKVEIS